MNRVEHLTGQNTHMDYAGSESRVPLTCASLDEANIHLMVCSGCCKIVQLSTAQGHRQQVALVVLPRASEADADAPLSCTLLAG